jgi:hypothetical protein
MCPASTRCSQLSSIAAALLLTSCGTIMHGTTQNVGISSSPTSAKVIIDNQDKGSTPLIADLKREQDHIVRVELAGYEPYETTLTHDLSGWAWGNILAGGLIGLAVDAISGGLYILGPEQVQATLAKHEATSAKLNAEGLDLALAMDPEPTCRVLHRTS